MLCWPTDLSAQVAVAKHGDVHAGLTYTIFNQMLELLLVFDMIVNVLRSFYNEQGVLVYSMKAIRIKYFSSYFLIDLVAAIPFQILVQV